MFVLTTISDVIPIAPADFNEKSAHAIQDGIHNKYTDKVLHEVGLCVCMWDLLSASEGLINAGDSRVHVDVTFRMVVFRPFKGEILQGTIAKVNQDGIRLSVDFFNDIWVPHSGLFEGVEYRVPENSFVWEFNGEEFAYDMKEVVRFRVESEVWHDQTPRKFRRDDEREDELVGVQKDAPYTIIGSMASQYTGPIHWWVDVSGEPEGNEME